MKTHCGVEIVVLKFSYIIRHGSDIITEYVNKKHLLTETSAQTNSSTLSHNRMLTSCKNVKKFQITSSLKQANTNEACVSIQTFLTFTRLPIH